MLLGVLLVGLCSEPVAAKAPSPGGPSAWPHTISRNGAEVTIYQPQAVQWPDRKILTARAAVAITTAGQKQALLGTVEISLATSTDEATGIVHLSDPKLLSTHFPSLDTAAAAALEAKIADALPDMQTRQVPLAAVLLSLRQSPVKSVEPQNDPPRIFYADHPASLVVFDGEPVTVPAGKSGLSYAVNTNWDVFASDGTWYLLNNGIWLKASSALGPYSPTTTLPPAFRSLPAEANFADARKALPARGPKSPQAVPTIFVSTTPAAIIVTEGAPKLAAVQGTALERVTNTPNTLLFDTADAHYYVLLAGRWFSAPALEAGWTFATDKLPGDFAMIDPGTPEAAVLASVPGTVAAQEAVLKALIPTTATLKRGAAKPSVAYVGVPHFEPIPGTSILHATNTTSVVLKVGEKFYVCEAGAWFVGPSPHDPWTLADAVPPEIRTIPPSSPYYNVTYGYTAGYAMGFVSAGVLVYGTGYYYPPVVVPGPVPVFLPYPYTYAGQVWYNSSTGAWARGGSVWGPYYGASGARAYNPTTGAWAQGGAVWGPYGGAGAWSAYNPSTGSYAHGSAAWGGGSGSANANWYNARTGISGSTNQNWNAYGRWGSSTFAGPSQTVNTESRSNANGSAGAFQSSTGAEGAGYHNRNTGTNGGAVKTANGDVYAGRDGNVYQHTDNGWSKWSNGGWQPVNPPTSSTGATQSTAANRSAAANGGNPRTSAGNPRTNGSERLGAVDPGSWNQLQQDRMGREFGQGQREFGGGAFQGRAGGGRFRRQ